MRSVVVLPQPDGPSMHEELAVGDGEVRVLHRDEIAEGLVQILDPDLGHGLYSGNWLTMMNITVPASMVDEGIGVERQRERLHQHDDADGDERSARRSPSGPRRKRRNGRATFARDDRSRSLICAPRRR